MRGRPNCKAGRTSRGSRQNEIRKSFRPRWDSTEVSFTYCKNITRKDIESHKWAAPWAEVPEWVEDSESGFASDLSGCVDRYAWSTRLQSHVRSWSEAGFKGNFFRKPANSALDESGQSWTHWSWLCRKSENVRKIVSPGDIKYSEFILWPK